MNSFFVKDLDIECLAPARVSVELPIVTQSHDEFDHAPLPLLNVRQNSNLLGSLQWLVKKAYNPF